MKLTGLALGTSLCDPWLYIQDGSSSESHLLRGTGPTLDKLKQDIQIL
jgi:hypothetical protein